MNKIDRLKQQLAEAKEQIKKYDKLKKDVEDWERNLRIFGQKKNIIVRLEGGKTELFFSPGTPFLRGFILAHIQEKIDDIEQQLKQFES